MTAPAWWRRLRDVDAMLVAFVLIALALLAFVKLASEVAEGETSAFDTAILEAVRHGTDGSTGFDALLRSVMLSITALGNSPVLTLIALIACGYLVALGRTRLAITLGALLLLGAGAEIGLKHVFGRARPDVVAHLVDVSSASFPSGHAMDSAMVYLTIAALLARTAQLRRVRLYIMGVALALVLAIGCSRIYAGVHWPTDVIAGWIAGSCWAVLCSMAVRRLGERR